MRATPKVSCYIRDMTTAPAKSVPQLEIDPASDLVSRYADQLKGSLRCFDRVIMHGTLIDVAHPGALLVSMHAAGFKPRDLARFGQPITTQVRDHIIGLARRNGIEIEMVTRKNFRQEDRVAAILKIRGRHAGLVHIFAVKEGATVFAHQNVLNRMVATGRWRLPMDCKRASKNTATRCSSWITNRSIGSTPLVAGKLEPVPA